MTQSSSELIGAAYHEAGHALVALHYGLQIGQLRVAENGDGATDIAPSDHLPLIDRAAVWMGGGAAHVHFQAPSTDHAMMADYEAILHLTPDMTDPDREAMIEIAFVRARDIIAINAGEVARLAKLLTALQRISFSDVRPPVVAKSRGGVIINGTTPLPEPRGARLITRRATLRHIPPQTKGSQ